MITRKLGAIKDFGLIYNKVLNRVRYIWQLSGQHLKMQVSIGTQVKKNITAKMRFAQSVDEVYKVF